MATSSTFYACRWLHNHTDQPVLLYGELDSDRFEVRKVEVFLDGRQSFADAIDEAAECSLSWVEVPELEEINVDPQFQAWPISREDFEVVWASRDGVGAPAVQPLTMTKPIGDTDDEP